MTRKSGKSQVGAFTLVELLVVIGIITILISITVPVVSHVRKAANGAATAAQIQAIRGAIEAYFQTFTAYPGPLADADIYGLSPNQLPSGINGNVTMAENLVLGLMGGLEILPNGSVNYNPLSRIGSGPMNLNPRNPKTYPPFLDLSPGLLSSDKSDDPSLNGKPKFGSTVWSSVFLSGKSGDSNIPEFVDRFPNDPMPILYLRARKGVSGVMSDTSTPGGSQLYQYDLRQISGYTTYGNIYGRPQGLAALGDMKEQGPGELTTAGFTPTRPPWNAIPYFKNSTLNLPTTKNQDGTPRSKDQYILISAGPDRIYGTSDDITTFGSVVP